MEWRLAQAPRLTPTFPTSHPSPAVELRHGGYLLTSSQESLNCDLVRGASRSAEADAQDRTSPCFQAAQGWGKVGAEAVSVGRFGAGKRTAVLMEG